MLTLNAVDYATFINERLFVFKTILALLFIVGSVRDTLSALPRAVAGLRGQRLRPGSGLGVSPPQRPRAAAVPFPPAANGCRAEAGQGAQAAPSCRRAPLSAPLLPGDASPRLWWGGLGSGLGAGREGGKALC